MQRSQGGGTQQQQHQAAQAHRHSGGVPLQLHLASTHQAPSSKAQHAGPPQRTGTKQGIEHISQPGTERPHPVGDFRLRATLRPARIRRLKAKQRQQQKNAARQQHDNGAFPGQALQR